MSLDMSPGGQCITDHAGEDRTRKTAAIGGAEEPPSGREAGSGEGDEVPVVLLDTEDIALVVA